MRSTMIFNRAVTVLALWLSSLQIASAGLPGDLSNCPVGSPSLDIAHVQDTLSRELILVCPFDPGHGAVTRNYTITNNTGEDWLAYLFDVALDPATAGFKFSWTIGDIFTPTMIDGDASIQIDAADARILFTNPLRDGESFEVNLRFAQYFGGTASVHGTPEVVPANVAEPGVLSLIGLTLLGVAVRRRR